MHKDDLAALGAEEQVGQGHSHPCESNPLGNDPYSFAKGLYVTNYISGNNGRMYKYTKDTVFVYMIDGKPVEFEYKLSEYEINKRISERKNKSIYLKEARTRYGEVNTGFFPINFTAETYAEKRERDKNIMKNNMDKISTNAGLHT